VGSLNDISRENRKIEKKETSLTGRAAKSAGNRNRTLEKETGGSGERVVGCGRQGGVYFFPFKGLLKDSTSPLAEGKWESGKRRKEFFRAIGIFWGGGGGLFS